MEKDVIFCLDGGADELANKVEACHQIMANASPVFRVMLDRNKFKEGSDLSRLGCCEINLPETNLEGFTILCQIFHLQGNLIPDRISVDLLYEIATLVDRYDCLDSIHPWPRIWKQNQQTQFDCRSKQTSPATITSVLRMIHISSIFEYDDVLRESSKYVLDNAVAKDFTDTNVEKVYNDLKPDVQELLFSRIDTYRVRVKALAIDTVSNLESGNSCRDTAGESEQSRFNCASMALGNAILGLIKAFGREWRGVEHWDKMPVELHGHMVAFALSMDGPSWVRTKSPYNRHHTSCALGAQLMRQLTSIREDAQKPLSIAELKNPPQPNVDEAEPETLVDQEGILEATQSMSFTS